MLKRLILTVALMANAAVAESIYVTPTGKTFHRTSECAILKRSPKVLTAERSTAESKGLHACRSCYAAKKANNSAWAKEAK